jgi:ABC-type sulfate transport system permease subunit
MGPNHLSAWLSVLSAKFDTLLLSIINIPINMVFIVAVLSWVRN